MEEKKSLVFWRWFVGQGKIICHFPTKDQKSLAIPPINMEDHASAIGYLCKRNIVGQPASAHQPKLVMFDITTIILSCPVRTHKCKG